MVILTADGTIASDWLVVITRHSDRLMVGTDTWVNSQRDNYEELVDLNRRWLRKHRAKLPSGLPTGMWHGCSGARSLRIFLD